MLRIIVVTIVVLGITALACHQNKLENETKVLDFGAFTIVTPKAWQSIKQQGIDSYAGRIALDSTDTVEFDLGMNVN